MHSPLPNALLSRLVGSTFEGAYHGQYTMQLVLSGENTLTVEAQSRFERADEVSLAPVQEFPLASSMIVRALGSKIEDARSEQDGTLRLGFSNGDVLLVSNDSRFEAYQAVIDGMYYVV